MAYTDKQKTDALDLLWDSLKRDPEHKDRRQTGWGTKTKEGLIACLERIAAAPELLDAGKAMVAYLGNAFSRLHSTPEERLKVLDNLVAAIAKAEGRDNA